MRIRLTDRQLEVLRIIEEYGSECWADVWSHCDGWPGGPLRSYLNFCRTSARLVDLGLVADNDGDIQITDDGLAQLSMESRALPSEMHRRMRDARASELAREREERG